MNTISSPKVYKVYYDGNNHTVVMEWSGYATSNEFRSGTELMLQTLVSNRCNKVLADIREMTLISMEDQRWTESVFLPRAIAGGFRALAIVKPESYFNKVAIENVSYKIDKEKVQINFFDNREEAESWLASI